MIRIIITTFPNPDEAAKVIRSLVEEKLAACGTIVPGARSIYTWEEGIEDITEAVVLLKTSEDTLPVLLKRVGELHPYEIPEIITLDPVQVSQFYADWVNRNCRHES